MFGIQPPANIPQKQYATVRDVARVKYPDRSWDEIRNDVELSEACWVEFGRAMRVYQEAMTPYKETEEYKTYQAAIQRERELAKPAWFRCRVFDQENRRLGRVFIEGCKVRDEPAVKALENVGEEGYDFAQLIDQLFRGKSARYEISRVMPDDREIREDVGNAYYGIDHHRCSIPWGMIDPKVELEYDSLTDNGDEDDEMEEDP